MHLDFVVIGLGLSVMMTESQPDFRFTISTKLQSLKSFVICVFVTKLYYYLGLCCLILNSFSYSVNQCIRFAIFSLSPCCPRVYCYNFLDSVPRAQLVVHWVRNAKVMDLIRRTYTHTHHTHNKKSIDWIFRTFG